MTGNCEISVEVTDPGDAGRHVDAWADIAPDDLRGMAGWVIRQCVQGVPPVGGFVTKNISDAIDYLQSPTATLDTRFWHAFVPNLSVPSLVGGANRVFYSM